MYKQFGNYNDVFSELKGINKIFNNSPIEIIKEYPESSNVIKSLEHSSSIHKEVRRFLQPYLRPGIKLIDIAKIIELKTVELYNLSNSNKSINKGIGFPVGLSVNDCAAHWHPMKDNSTVLKKDDIIKIDFGTETNGWITDSAFTVCFDSKYDNLMTAVKEATETGIKNIGVDVHIGEWGKSIQEVMESYEITLNGKTYPIRAVKNLGGHNIIKGIIHGGLFLPSVDYTKIYGPNMRFVEGIYAVETFGSTGDNSVHEQGDCTLYRTNPNFQMSNINLPMENSKKLYRKINQKFDTLPFTDRYLDDSGIPGYRTHLKLLVNKNILHGYPPLHVNPEAYTAQYEHTVYIGENKKIVFSRGDDY